MAAPLEGIRVLDWTMWKLGPVGSAMLGDLGAEVIKIEPREGDPTRSFFTQLQLARDNMMQLPGGRSISVEYNNHNKKSITVDVKHERGREVIYRLVKKSDVFVQNYRPGVAERRGLGYETLSQYNPRLIYASASGFGPMGPDSQDAAMDILGLARSGIMFAIGEPEMGPMTIEGAIGDQIGAFYLAYGVLAALLARERTGIGQKFDVSILGGMIALLGLPVTTACLRKPEEQRQSVGRAKAANPLWNYYKCQGGKWLAMSHSDPRPYWGPFCQAIGMPELENDPRFARGRDREEHAEELIAILDGVFATRTVDEWLKVMKGKFMVAPVNTFADLPNDPQLLANEYITEWDHPVLGRVKTLGMPFHLSKTPGSTTRLPAPELGEHTEEVLTELAGYSRGEIEELRRLEVI